MIDCQPRYDIIWSEYNGYEYKQLTSIVVEIPDINIDSYFVERVEME